MKTWLIVFLLGAYHGLNPAMGWLFAVALGLQEHAGRAVYRSLLPLGLGHLLSVTAVVALAEAAEFTLPLATVRIIAASILVGFGVYRLVRRRHPRWVGMRVGSSDLALWSFLMASAHGAGLMLLPFILPRPQASMAMNHMHHLMVADMMSASPHVPLQVSIPVAMHTIGYLLVTAALALIVYYKLGVAFLRRAWFNLDLLWSGALIAMGLLMLVV